MTTAERHARAIVLGWKSCGDCVLDDCCGLFAPVFSERGYAIRCTRPFGHDGDHVVCYDQQHRIVTWGERP